MKWTLPGTLLQIDGEDVLRVEEMFSSMFLAGGITLSQVAAVTGLETYMIQNWVKRGFLTAPKNKRYSLRQLCRIININMLKDALALEDICGLLHYINGRLDDESDDLVDDSCLYFFFVRMASRCRQDRDVTQDSAYLEQLLSDYREPVPGAKDRLSRVLEVMLTAWAAAQLRQKAVTMVGELKQ